MGVPVKKTGHPTPGFQEVAGFRESFNPVFPAGDGGVNGTGKPYQVKASGGKVQPCDLLDLSPDIYSGGGRVANRPIHHFRDKIHARDPKSLFCQGNGFTPSSQSEKKEVSPCLGKMRKKFRFSRSQAGRDKIMICPERYGGRTTVGFVSEISQLTRRKQKNRNLLQESTETDHKPCQPDSHCDTGSG